MRVGDRGEPGDDIVREPVRILIPKALYALCIPSHDNVGQQSQGSGDGLHLLGRPAPCNPSTSAFPSGIQNVRIPVVYWVNGQEFIPPENVRLADRSPANPQKAESVGISTSWH
jgi:hypothetical protein